MRSVVYIFFVYLCMRCLVLLAFLLVGYKEDIARRPCVFICRIYEGMYVIRSRCVCMYVRERSTCPVRHSGTCTTEQKCRYTRARKPSCLKTSITNLNSRKSTYEEALTVHRLTRADMLCTMHMTYIHRVISLTWTPFAGRTLGAQTRLRAHPTRNTLTILDLKAWFHAYEFVSSNCMCAHMYV